jgi:hypothetical protein
LSDILRIRQDRTLLPSHGIPVIQDTPFGELGIRFRRPANIEAAADRWITNGGRYRTAVLLNGQVLFAATVGQAPDIFQVVGETTSNGPEMLDAIDRVVLQSVTHIAAVH